MARDLPAARRLRFTLVIEALEQYGAGRHITILDAGCGEGILAEALGHRHPEWTIVAVDEDEIQLKKGRDRTTAAGLGNVRFSTADLTKDLGHELYDGVLAIECLEEIPDDQAALASMARALRPRGIFIAHVPERNWAPVLPCSDRTWKNEVRHGYAQAELEAMLSRCGLLTTSTSPSTRGTVRVAQEIRDLIKDRGLLTQTLAYPLVAAAPWLERRGFTWGPGRALFVQALRS